MRNLFKMLGVVMLLVLLGSAGFCAGAAQQVKALPTSSEVLVYGESIAFEAYNINGNNYFKLRDVAQAFKEKKAQFQVVWNSSKQSIFITKDREYTTIGGELQKFFESKQRVATPTTAKVYVDGTEVSLTAYNINGNNYFKLRDLGDKLDFAVEWNEAENQVIIGNTVQPEPDPEPNPNPNPDPDPGTSIDPSKKTIIVDAGHGGTDPGAINPITKQSEKETNLTVALKLAELLQADGYHVILTRTKVEQTISLPTRMEQIQEVKPDLYVSVHHNATDAHSAKGAEVMAQVLDEGGGRTTLLAKYLKEEFAKNGQSFRRVVYRYNSTEDADYYGLLRAAQEVDVPAVISEYAFIDHAEDVLKIDTTEELHAEAQAIYGAIVKYFAADDSLKQRPAA